MPRLACPADGQTIAATEANGFFFECDRTRTFTTKRGGTRLLDLARNAVRLEQLEEIRQAAGQFHNEAGRVRAVDERP